MNADEGFDDDGPFHPWVPPDDRLWRHPSEGAGAPTQPFFVRSLSPTRNTLSKPWTTALIAGVVGALLASGIGVATGGFVRTTVIRPYAAVSAPSTTMPTEAASISQDPQPAPSWSAVYDQLAPSLVVISGSSDAGLVTTSGMVWKDDNSGQTYYILADDEDLQGMSSVRVSFANGSAPGRVIGTDTETGLAVIAVAQRALPAGVAWASLGRLTDIQVGDSLAVVGSGTDADGLFNAGVVNSLFSTVDGPPDSGVSMVGMIAVATAGPVATGTAVVESDGSVVGLTVATGANEGTSFSYAVPMDMAATIGNQLIDKQRPWHPWIGILAAQDFPGQVAASMGLSGGAIVDAVSPGSPAAQSGLAPRDVILSIGNTSITSTGTLTEALDQCQYQSRWSLRYLDGNKEVTSSITVISQPANPLGT